MVTVDESKKPTRILLMMSSLAMGGAERNIASLLPFLKDSGVDITLCSMNTRRDNKLFTEIPSLQSVERFNLNARHLMDPTAFRRLLTLIRERKIDIIHAQDQDTIIFAGLAGRLTGVPAVMTRHVLDESSATWKKRIRSRLVLLSARFGCRRVIAVSEAVRGHFAKLAGIPLSRIETIHNGIELERYSQLASRTEIRKKLGWDLNRPIAVFVSVFRPVKGFDVLFNSIPRVLEQIPDFQVKLVGGGKLDGVARELAAPLGSTVEFLGQRMDIPELIGASDLLIQTSRSEALPTVLIEAGAAGRPVAATNVGGSSEIVEDGTSGFLVPSGDSAAMGDAILRLLTDSAMAERMGKAAQKRIFEKFTLVQQARATAKFYKEILGASRVNESLPGQA